jgi:thiamine-phosphate pyrophosphorylase
MVICVTNRTLCREDFMHRIGRLAAARPHAVMLREKDLEPAAYERLARQAKELCDRCGVPFIVHQHAAVAEKVGASHLHLTLSALRAYKHRGNLAVGASVHSPAEAVEAEALGAVYLIAGHIFATDSKNGLPPRGLSFLRQVCEAVRVPVFAIGGIDAANARAALACGAAGVCVMSAAMACEDPAALVREFKKPSGR